VFLQSLLVGAGAPGECGAVPGSSFFLDPAMGRDLIRLAFPKRLETLRAAGERLAVFAGPRSV
jgi:hypothetical protein